MTEEQEEYGKSFNIQIWKRLLPFFKPYKKQFAITFLLNIILAAVDVVVPLFQSEAIDRFIIPDTLSGIGWFAALYVLVIVVQTVCVYVSVHAAIIIDMNVGKDLKWAQFKHLQLLSFSYYNRTPVGYIHARVMSDTLRISTLTAWSLVDLFWALLYVITIFVIMFVLNARLAVIILLIVPCLAGLTAFFQNRILHWNRQARQQNAKITNAYNEELTGIRTTKSMVLEQDNYDAFTDLSSQMKRLVLRGTKLNAIYVPLILFFSSVTAAFVLARGGYMAKEGLMKLGTLSVFLSYSVILFEPIQQIARILADIISCQANIERVMALLDEEPNVFDTEDVKEKYGDSFDAKDEKWERIKGDIVFEDVSFMYPDGKEYVLEHFNLRVPRGTNVAIVGETGAGKSTLVNLLGRFFEPTSGRILIDGEDYKARSLHWLHSQMGYVLQNPHLFSGTVRENIRYGRLSATDEEVEEAAKKAFAHPVIQKLEKKYDSEVGENGGKLSVGEKQLISFARAILVNPSIFVLDEATSSIDTQTEELIQKATEELLEGHTSFVIAHRLSTIRKADLILVVQDGKIIEQGDHRSLLEKRGHYFDLYSRQFEEEEAIRILS